MPRQRTVLCSHTSSRRDSWWYLEQDDDGSIWIRHENDDDHSDDWRRPLQEVLMKGSGSGCDRELQERINRMFQDA
jgi:hypothetical protein